MLKRLGSAWLLGGRTDVRGRWRAGALGWGLAVGGAFGALSLAPPAVVHAQKAPVLSPARDKLVLLSDGKSHYIALVPFQRGPDTLFYGDGKRFYAMPVQGGSAAGKERFSVIFIDPRYYVGFTQRSEILLQNGKYTVTCGKSETPLSVVETAKAQPLLAAATFEQSPRKWQAYALARNSAGIYYYVDQGYIDRSRLAPGEKPEGNRNFRLFVGPKGNLKLQRMTNVVSDSEGDVFSTKTGSMRLVIGKKEPTWIEKGKAQNLLPVPIDENLAMIYTELGVYTGERLGTPCDDL